MFAWDRAPGRVRDDIRAMATACWRSYAEPGTWWNGYQRTALAETARRAWLGDDLAGTDLPDVAVEAAELLAAHPALTSKEWVDGVVGQIGVAPYIEIIGIVAQVVAIDTFTRLLGSEPEPFLPSTAGEPTRELVDPEPRQIRTWVPMGEVLIPPFTLSMVPAEQQRTNDLAEALYMTGQDMEDPDFRRGSLHRTQIELVAASLSFENECFY